MADIIATTPVTVPGTSSVTYDKWYLTQLNAVINPVKAPCNVRLNRSAVVDGKSVLMPATEDKSTVSFNCDLWKEVAADPTVIGPLAQAAIDANLALVVAIATKKKLL